MKKCTGKQTLALVAAIAAAIGLLAGGAVGLALQPEPVTITETVTVTEQVEVPVIQEVEVIQEVIVYNETVVEVAVEDNDFIELACDRLFYEDLEECREEVEAENVALALAVAELEKNGFDYLDDEGLFGDEDDLDWVYIKDSFEDLVDVESDFDDDEYTFQILAKVEDDKEDEKERFVFEVSVEDGEAEIIDAWVEE
jgi:hypothetical protein